MDYNQAILNIPGVIDGRETLPSHATKTWEQRDPSKIQGIVYHQSLENYGIAKNVAKYHVNPNHVSSTGLPGLSYTLFVEKFNKIVLANSIECTTYSQGDRSKPGDENKLYLGVCFGGNFSAPGYKGPQEPTLWQLHSAITLWTEFKRIFKFSNNQLYGHYDFGKPACPGTTIQTLVESINQDKDWVDPPNHDLNTIVGRQQALTTLGYYQGEVDGLWGSGSIQALAKFQANSNLTPDGVWGKQTQAAVLAQWHW